MEGGRRFMAGWRKERRSAAEVRLDVRDPSTTGAGAEETNPVVRVLYRSHQSV